MNEMTLPSRHKIRNSRPGGLRPSTLPLGYGGRYLSVTEAPHNIDLYEWAGKKHFVSLKPEVQIGIRTPDL